MRLPLPVIPAQVSSTTPTRAEALRECLLRAAFDISDEHRAVVVRGPAARLGTACHEVLEAAARGHFDTVGPEHLAEAFDRLWDERIKREEQAALQAPLEHHFGSSKNWPYYELKRAYLRRLVQTMVDGRGDAWLARQSGDLMRSKGEAERLYSGFDGKLIGRADYIVERGDQVEIEDYKTGPIFETADLGNAEIKAAYRRQLLLYAALHWAETGVWPSKAHLIGLQGDRFSMDIEPEAARYLVQETIARLDIYNQLVASGVKLDQFAQPSPEACRRCSYKACCDPFWATAKEDWDLPGGAYISGSIVEVEALTDSGRVLGIEASQGNLPPGRYRLRGLTAVRFPGLAELKVGTNARVLGARITRPDAPRDVVPTDYTQLWWGPNDAE